MAKETVQQKFDALIAEHGAEAVIVAIKAHRYQPSIGGGTCSPACKKGYYCSQGDCILDVGE